MYQSQGTFMASFCGPGTSARAAMMLKRKAKASDQPAASKRSKLSAEVTSKVSASSKLACSLGNTCRLTDEQPRWQVPEAFNRCRQDRQQIRGS